MPRVEIVYATPAVQRRYTVDLADGETVRAAIDQCGVLRECPEIDLARERIGVHGRLVALADVLREGDRVEILRPLVADPKTGRRRRAQSARRRT
jgi:putative ubiquitin-RnfH superfamily antitoxin RatB of RatAB toxin-antitoxin module